MGTQLISWSNEGSNRVGMALVLRGYIRRVMEIPSLPNVLQEEARFHPLPEEAADLLCSCPVKSSMDPQPGGGPRPGLLGGNPQAPVDSDLALVILSTALVEERFIV